MENQAHSDSSAAGQAGANEVRPSRPWQFSLRELLMLTVIAALGLTVWRLSVREQTTPTPFYRGFDAQALGRKIAADAGVREGSGGGASGSESPQYALKSFDYHFVFFGPNRSKLSRAAFMAAMKREIDHRLKAAECEVHGRGRRGNPNDLHAFDYRYSHGDRQGYLHIHATETGEDRIHLIGFLLELPRR